MDAFQLKHWKLTRQMMVPSYDANSAKYCFKSLLKEGVKIKHEAFRGQLFYRGLIIIIFYSKDVSECLLTCCLVPYVADSPHTRQSNFAGDPLTTEIQD